MSKNNVFNIKEMVSIANEEIKKQNVERALGVACNCFLTYGIEFVTKEMISKESGISRSSLSRYWEDRTDCVIKVAEWFRKDVKQDFNEYIPNELWNNKKAIEQLETFMLWCADLYSRHPYKFSLYSEFKIYLNRACPGFWKSNREAVTAFGFSDLLTKIYIKGVDDGSVKITYDIQSEVAFIGDSYFGYLSNLAFRATEETIAGDVIEIQRFIARMIDLYKK